MLQHPPCCSDYLYDSASTKYGIYNDKHDKLYKTATEKAGDLFVMMMMMMTNLFYGQPYGQKLYVFS